MTDAPILSAEQICEELQAKGRTDVTAVLDGATSITRIQALLDDRALAMARACDFITAQAAELTTLRAEVERLRRERDGYVSWLNNLTFFESDGETERSLNVVWEGEDSYIEAGDEIFSDMKARVEALEKAGRGILDRMFDTYKAGNGRDVGIQGDDGEKCWIVHSDEIAALRAALGA